MKLLKLSAAFAACTRARRIQLHPRAFQLRCRYSAIDPHPLPRPVSTSAHQIASTQHNQRIADPESASAEREAETSVVVEKDTGHDEVEQEADKEEEAPTKSAHRPHHSRQSFLRSVMRTVPDHVCIVTSCDPEAGSWRTGTQGALISSFQTVTMGEDCYVSFNLYKETKTLKAILESKRFTVTFPSNTSAGQRLASNFLRSIRRGRLEDSGVLRWQDEHADISVDYPAIPTLSLKKDPTESGFAFALFGDYHQSVQVGDHFLIIGRISDHLPIIGQEYGWGFDVRSREAFPFNDVTLAYVHKNFANPDNGAGIDQAWKYDDPFLQRDLASAKHPVYEKLMRYRLYPRRIRELRRIATMERAKRGSDRISSQRLKEYIQHYEERLEQHQRLILEDDEGLTGWQRKFVHRKSLQTPSALHAEQDQYASQLTTLYNRVKDRCPDQSSQYPDSQQTESNQTATSESVNLPTVTEPDPIESNSTRGIGGADGRVKADDIRQTTPPDVSDQDLIAYFETRLKLVLLAEVKSRMAAGPAELRLDPAKFPMITSRAMNDKYLPSVLQNYRLGLNQAQLLEKFHYYSGRLTQAQVDLVVAESKPETQSNKDRIKYLQACVDEAAYRRELLQLLVQESISEAPPERLNKALHVKEALGRGVVRKIDSSRRLGSEEVEQPAKHQSADAILGQKLQDLLASHETATAQEAAKEAPAPKSATDDRVLKSNDDDATTSPTDVVNRTVVEKDSHTNERSGDRDSVYTLLP